MNYKIEEVFYYPKNRPENRKGFYKNSESISCQLYLILYGIVALAMGIPVLGLLFLWS